MMKFVQKSTSITESVGRVFDNASRNMIATLLLFGAALACTLPWVTSTGTSLAANTYDLAEWLSLHPTVRATSAILLPALLLRLTLAVVALLAVIQAAQNTHRWFVLPIALGLWVGLLPPVAFLQGNFSDANYLQQALLWGGTTLGAVILWQLPYRLQRFAVIVLVVVGTAGAIWSVWVA
jgi:hypothetical protein